ncbi:MAG TPA: nitrogenase iron protein NifH [bacterium]|nr:nitrogenase iron protein NifH [bacterium]
MRQIAFYGKGGSGKSTIASNLSVVAAAAGKKVLQVGCDPKHDSTRSLLGGNRPATAVELLREKRPEKIRADELVFSGSFGIDCIEVGGPEPGAGCAGLGIIKTMELIKSLKLLDRNYDYIFFDVLGDVVCGGFAAPMRLKFADEVYVVISGEMMSLYAANNICRGILRYARTGKVRLGGFIGNQRSSGIQTEILARFADRLGSQTVFLMPWSKEMINAERAGKTVVEFSPDSDTADRFRQLAERIENNTGQCIPEPMSDEEFEDFFRNNVEPDTT